MVALASQRDRLTAATGGLPAARDERDGVDRRDAQLQRDARGLRDQLAERDVVAPPAWARETLGERPANPRAGEQCNRGVRAIARFRVEYDVAQEIPGLRPEPDDQRAPGAWRQAATTVRQVQVSLGRSVERDRVHDRGTGIELEAHTAERGRLRRPAFDVPCRARGARAGAARP